MSQRQLLTGFRCTATVLCAVIVAHAVPAQNNAPVKQLRAVRELSINPDDPNWAVISPADLAVDARGLLYVLDYTDQIIRVFDSGGVPVRRIARKGNGPGELSTASALFVVRDSLWAIEMASSRVTRFPLSGGAGRTSVIRPKTTQQGTTFAIASSGFLATTQDTSRPDWASMFVRVDAAGMVLNTVLPATPRIKTFMVFNIVPEGLRDRSTYGRQHASQPLVSAPIVSFDPNGNGVVRGASSAAPFAGEYSLTAIGIAGDTTWRRVFRYSPIPVTDAQIREIIENLAAPTVSDGIRIVGDRKMIRDSLVLAKSWPAFTALTIGLDGSVFLKQGGPTTPLQTYWRFSPAGVANGRFEMPATFRLFRATTGKVWGVSRDKDGNALIERYRLQ
ncbi:MAG: hypothetical protein ABJB74_03130 [Gemmatimonas sp.]